MPPRKAKAPASKGSSSRRAIAPISLGQKRIDFLEQMKKVLQESKDVPPDIFEDEPEPEQIRRRWSYKTAPELSEKDLKGPPEAETRFNKAIDLMLERKEQMLALNQARGDQRKRDQRVPMAFKGKVQKTLEPITPRRLEPKKHQDVGKLAPTARKIAQPKASNRNVAHHEAAAVNGNNRVNRTSIL